MRAAALVCAALLAAPAAGRAQDGDPCAYELAALAVSLPDAVDLAGLQHEITANGWCRITEAASPLDGLEWHSDSRSEGVIVALRESANTVPFLGDIALDGQLAYRPGAGRVTFDTLLLGRDADNYLSLSAGLNWHAPELSGGATAAMRAATLDALVIDAGGTGQGGLLTDAVGAVFGLSAEAARADPAVARQQRESLQRRIDGAPATLLSSAARAEIANLVAAWPDLGGRLRLSLRFDRPFPLGALMLNTGTRTDGLSEAFGALHLDVDWQPGG